LVIGAINAEDANISPPVEVEERRRTFRVLHAGLVHVEVHPVDRLDLERDVPVQDIGHAAG
jgi:hypothetical protein